jgi:formamidopyrimidine-DNA glycosylase
VPELPDVVLYVEALRRRILGQPLERIRLASPFVLRTTTPSPDELAGRPVVSLARLGKRIVIGLDDEVAIVLHLMIAGRLRWRARDAPPIAGRHVLAAFDFPAGILFFTEAGSKKRASLHLVRGAEALAEFDRGGLEPLEATRDAFAAALRRENHTLKRALTDPRLFSGIGNAYSDEILHRARLSPVRLTHALTDAGIDALYDATRAVLSEWIERLAAETGDAFPEKVTAFRAGMTVHGRYGQPCPVCGTPVQRIVYAEHEANYCPGCQTGGRLLADRSLSRLLGADWPRTMAELEEKTRTRAAAARTPRGPRSGRPS